MGLAPARTTAGTAGRRSRLREVATTPAGGTCTIKGNISRNGERIYHLPGQQHYAQTKINEANGERWFCTEADAQAAGWRNAKQ